MFACALLVVGPALAPAAAAYETDQLTDRDVPLADALPLADAEVQAALAAAAAEVNQKTGCKGSDRRVRAVLAANIASRLGRPEYVPGRPFPSGLGHHAAAAWAETVAPTRRFDEAPDVYDEVGPSASLVLWATGPCATIRLGPYLVGTDKLDHFWELGHRYAVASRWGRAEDRAVAYGTASERGVYGLLTSGVFSFADLRANWDGMRFYNGLLGDESVLSRDDAGCVAVRRPFTWLDWVSDSWDEAKNPPVLRIEVARAVQERLRSNRDRYCAIWRGLDRPAPPPDGDGARPPWVGEAAPEPDDPYRLAALCAEPTL